MTRSQLDRLYRTYNRRVFIEPDPLQVVYDFEAAADREVVGLIAACLAFGRVASILQSVEKVLNALGPEPAARLRDEPVEPLRRELEGVVHRWTRTEHLLELFEGLHRVLNEHESLGACFAAAYRPRHPDILPTLTHLANELVPGGNKLLSQPDRGSACKRLHMYLRWMLRSDDVDPGCWTGLGVPAAKLLVPVDTHMFQVGRRLGFTERKQANLLAVRDITAGFKAIRPRDPVRYDFALTRLGIRADASFEELD